MNVYLLDVMSIPERDITKYARVLDEDRRKGIAQCRRGADKLRSFGAGIALLYAWKTQFGEREMPEIMREENGKPCFSGENIPFCLSHSGAYAACVLGEGTDGASLGLDIQEPRAVRAGLAERFFSDGERAQLLSGESACLIWSRKESLAKYRGSGLRGDLRALDTSGESIALPSDQDQRTAEEGSDPPSYQGRLQAEAAADRHLVRTAEGACLWSCVTADGYALSVCKDRPVDCRPVFLSWEQIKEEL